MEVGDIAAKFLKREVVWEMESISNKKYFDVNKKDASTRQ